MIISMPYQEGGSPRPIQIDLEPIQHQSIIADLYQRFEEGRETGTDAVLPVFANERQIGDLISLDLQPSLEFAASEHQQTLIVLRGSASLKIGETITTASAGDIVVTPQGASVAYSEADGDFLGYRITSPFDAVSEESGEAAGEILQKNIQHLQETVESVAFMSTNHAHPDAVESKVREIDVFNPTRREEGYALNGSQAGRLLIMKEETMLDRHTHPIAQHALLVVDGQARIEHEGTFHILNEGQIIIVPTDTRHMMGTTGEGTVLVINSPGLDSSHPDYHRDAEPLTA